MTEDKPDAVFWGSGPGAGEQIMVSVWTEPVHVEVAVKRGSLATWDTPLLLFRTDVD